MTDQSKAPVHERRGARVPRRVLAGVTAAALALGAALAAGQVQASLRYGELLRADPDAETADKTLAAFAADQARPLFAEHCAACHGGDMKGSTARGVPDLTDADWLYGDGRAAEIEKTILYGIRSGHPKSWNLADMPAFGEADPYRRYPVAPLRPQQIRDVVEYLMLVQGRRGDQAAAARGAEVFANAGQCFDCHADDVAGDPAIGAPDLADGITLYGDGSRASLFRSIAHGRAGACPAWAGVLKAGQARALAVYLHNAAARPGPQAAAPPLEGKSP